MHSESTMRIDLSDLPEQIDPAAHMTNSGWIVLSSVSITLFDIGADQSLVGRLAESWESFDEGKRFRIRIRKDARFQNGTPITVEDLVFSLKRKQKFCPLYDLFEWIDLRKPDSLRIIGDRLIEFRLERSYPYFLFLLALPGTGIVPKKLYGTESPSRDLPILGGPYQITEWKRKKYMKLRWYDGWIEKRESQPREIIIHEHDDQESVSRFLSGVTNVFFDRRNQLTNSLIDHAVLNKFRVHFPKFNSVRLAYFNAVSGPLKDQKIREAFAEVVKRYEFSQKQDPRSTLLADQFFPPGYSGRTTEYERPKPNPRFESFFSELRKSPVTLTQMFVRGRHKGDVSPIAEFAKAYGFKIVSEVVSFGEIKRRRNQGEGFDFAYWFIPVPPGDPCLVFRLDFGPDDFFVKDPNQGRLYEMIKRTSIGGTLDHRITLAKEINNYIASQSFIVPLVFHNAPTYASEDIDLSRLPAWEFNVKFSDFGTLVKQNKKTH